MPFFRNKNSSYGKEVESKQRIADMYLAIEKCLTILKDNNEELTTALKGIQETVKYLNPTADSKDSDKKILNTLDDIYLGINKAIKKQEYDRVFEDINKLNVLLVIRKSIHKAPINTNKVV